jgi:predicted metal-dependent phosphoesterase TrpH
VRDAIDLIHQAGGIAVAAHPGGAQSLTMQELKFLIHSEKDIRDYVDWGLDGIEVSHPCHTAEEKQFYSGLAQEYGLLTTAGSDCHGDDPFLGQVMMGVFTDIPENLYDTMLAYYEEKQVV